MPFSRTAAHPSPPADGDFKAFALSLTQCRRILECNLEVISPLSLVFSFLLALTCLLLLVSCWRGECDLFHNQLSISMQKMTQAHTTGTRSLRPLSVFPTLYGSLWCPYKAAFRSLLWANRSPVSAFQNKVSRLCNSCQWQVWMVEWIFVSTWMETCPRPRMDGRMMDG